MKCVQIGHCHGFTLFLSVCVSYWVCLCACVLYLIPFVLFCSARYRLQQFILNSIAPTCFRLFGQLIKPALYVHFGFRWKVNRILENKYWKPTVKIPSTVILRQTYGLYMHVFTMCLLLCSFFGVDNNNNNKIKQTSFQYSERRSNGLDEGLFVHLFHAVSFVSLLIHLPHVPFNRIMHIRFN